MMNNKCVCEECDWHGIEEDLLEAENPFARREIIVGCPECKQVNCLQYACDEEGCWNKVSKGYGTDEGYKIACYKH